MVIKFKHAVIFATLLPWKNCMGRGQHTPHNKQLMDIATTRPNQHSGQIPWKLKSFYLNIKGFHHTVINCPYCGLFFAVAWSIVWKAVPPRPLAKDYLTYKGDHKDPQEDPEEGTQVSYQVGNKCQGYLATLLATLLNCHWESHKEPEEQLPTVYFDYQW